MLSGYFYVCCFCIITLSRIRTTNAQVPGILSLTSLRDLLELSEIQTLRNRWLGQGRSLSDLNVILDQNARLFLGDRSSASGAGISGDPLMLLRDRLRHRNERDRVERVVPLDDNRLRQRERRLRNRRVNTRRGDRDNRQNRNRRRERNQSAGRDTRIPETVRELLDLGQRSDSTRIGRRGRNDATLIGSGRSVDRFLEMIRGNSLRDRLRLLDRNGRMHSLNGAGGLVGGRTREDLERQRLSIQGPRPGNTDLVRRRSRGSVLGNLVRRVVGALTR